MAVVDTKLSIWGENHLVATWKISAFFEVFIIYPMRQIEEKIPLICLFLLVKNPYESP